MVYGENIAGGAAAKTARVPVMKSRGFVCGSRGVLAATRIDTVSSNRSSKRGAKTRTTCVPHSLLYGQDGKSVAGLDPYDTS